MENDDLRQTFLTTCYGHRIFHPINPLPGSKKTALIPREKIIDFIPGICSSVGMKNVTEDDAKLLTNDKGTLNEAALLAMGESVTRQALTVATVLMAIRYRRSGILIDAKMVAWVRKQVVRIKTTKAEEGSCHGPFLDWYKLVNKHLFSQISTKPTEPVRP